MCVCAGSDREWDEGGGRAITEKGPNSGMMKIRWESVRDRRQDVGDAEKENGRNWKDNNLSDPSCHSLLPFSSIRTTPSPLPRDNKGSRSNYYPANIAEQPLLQPSLWGHCSHSVSLAHACSCGPERAILNLSWGRTERKRNSIYGYMKVYIWCHVTATKQAVASKHSTLTRKQT